MKKKLENDVTFFNVLHHNKAKTQKNFKSKKVKI